MPSESAPSPGKVSRRSLVLAGIVASLVVVFLVLNGISSRNASEAKLKETTDALSVPTVAVVQPGLGGNKLSLDLPGRLEQIPVNCVYIRHGGSSSWRDVGRG